ncbi:VOC family protein [Notoacmeibacter sp. MSK16QG-6]|uniref:bleomycin resistance protein n=1 Tax=Notoacmeibacter sp. MSK16QG-6 TaxID=2957982 RepID=UPI0020A19215|nr:VOC family protein [Notoacmeibacter sp. MSK16QG-6]MCP1198649.1 VOC family protein [Notoacmeibacter sp. MSK16QG-6]
MKLVTLTPILPVRAIKESIDFYERFLGFSCSFQTEDYAYIARDGIACRLVTALPAKDMNSPDSQVHIYIDVDGIDELYSTMQSQLKKLPKGRHRPLFDTPYGYREFHVIDPDVTLISFGERVSTSP